MPLDSALLVPVDGDLSIYVGKKIRIAARLLGYDYSTGIALLADNGHGILVDPSLCLDPFEQDHWARQLRMPIMVIGHLEETTEPAKIPKISAYAEELATSPTLLLKAILLQPEPTLDLRLWNEAIYARQKFFREGFPNTSIASVEK